MEVPSSIAGVPSSVVKMVSRVGETAGRPKNGDIMCEGVHLRRGIYGREGEGGHLHPSVAERKTCEYKRRKPADAGFC